MRASTPKPRL